MQCRSQRYRHSVCIYGVEDFAWLAKHPKLIANKMMPSFDYGVVDCVHELIFNRTHLGQTDRLWDVKMYERQPHVSVFATILLAETSGRGRFPKVETWAYDGKMQCRSQRYRHSVCIYGVEDFAWLAKHPKLIANKMMPSFDYGVVDCVHELIFNRTHLGQTDRLWDVKMYERQPHVSVFATILLAETSGRGRFPKSCQYYENYCNVF
ncbi:hypothetical protein COOONC_14447 [Cooperia oncophora]